jgi:hypothetical protein
MFIDAHTHTQPSPADKAEFDQWSEARDRSRAGTVDELLSGMGAAEARHTMVVPWLPAQLLVEQLVEKGEDRERATASVVERWRRLNRWAAAETRAPRAHAVRPCGRAAACPCDRRRPRALWDELSAG